MINTMDAYGGISDVRIEGIETIAVRYKTLVEATKKKTYNILDHRKGDFDVDYVEFRDQFDNLRNSMQNFVDTWFEKNLTVSTDYSLNIANVMIPSSDIRNYDVPLKKCVKHMFVFHIGLPE